MKRIALAALAASAVMATPAMAATAQQSTAFIANRAIVCDLTGVAQEINFGTLGEFGAASSQTDSGINLLCNQPFSVNIKSLNGYLKLTATTPANLATGEAAPFTSGANPGFAAGLDYTATATVGSNTFTGNSSQITAGNAGVNLGNSPAVSVSGASIVYSTTAGSLPLLGGDYGDTLTITLTTLGV